MKGWLDNFGKADNANDSNVSLPEGFVGLAYNIKGRNYSPAWGGQFEQGGIIPIAQNGVSEYMKKKMREKEDESIAAQYNLPEVVVQGFRDPSPFEQAGRMPQYTPSPTVPYLEKTKDPAEFFKSWITSPEYRRRKIETDYPEYVEYSPVTGDEINDPYKGSLIDRAMRNNFLKLEQIQRPGAITYDPKRRSEYFEEWGEANIRPQDFDKDNTALAHEVAHAVDTQEADLSRKEYELLTSATKNWGERLPQSLSPELYARADRAKHLEEPRELRADLNALRFLLYDKDIYDIRKGQKFTKEHLEKAKEKLKDNFALDRLLMISGDENLINLMNIIAKKDEELTPIAMNGTSMPGAVGFTYARVAGAAPSKGKYAKKTMASAQNGIIADKIAGLELKMSPEYQRLKYLQSLPQLRQAPGRGEELLREGLATADIATDLMQIGNFIPHPMAQGVGKAGNILGSGVDLAQALMSARQGNYLDAAINLGSVGLAGGLASSTFRRNSKYLQPGQPLYALSPQAFGSLSRTNYIEPFRKVGKMTDKNLLANRALLGLIGAETVYDAIPQKEYGGEIPSAQNGEEDIKTIDLPEIVVTPYDEQYPFYQTLSEEEKKYINDKGPIGRGIRSIATTGKRGQSAKDISSAVRDVQQTGAEFTGIPGTIRFSEDPLKKLTGTGKTLLDLAMVAPGFGNPLSAITGPLVYGLNDGINPITGEQMFNEQNLEGAFDTLDALGMVTGAAALLKQPVQKGLQQGVKATRNLLKLEDPIKAVSKISSKNLSPTLSTPVAQAPTSWSMQEAPGLHLKSTMSDGPISKIVEPKTGLVNVEQALAIIGKESGGPDKVALIKQGMGENIPKKMDFNEFRKTVQDQLIPLERQFVTHRSNYGLADLGYFGKPFFDDYNNVYRVTNAKDLSFKTQEEALSFINKNGPLENQTLILGNKDKFGVGSSAHGNPNETLGHIHFLRDAETPDVLTVTQIQSDAFQGSHRSMPKSKEAAEFSLSYMEKHQEELKKLYESAKPRIGTEDIDGNPRFYELPDGRLITKEQYFEGIPGQTEINNLKKIELENFTQKSLLDKNHQERYLQELISYAGERGDVNKIRLPTRETAANIQGYSKITSNELDWISEGQKVKFKDGEGIINDDTIFSNSIDIKLPNGETKLVPIEELKLYNKELVEKIEPKVEYSASDETILKKYSEQPKTIKKLFGVEPKIVKDDKGNSWYEFDIPKSFKEGKGEIKAFKNGGKVTTAQNGQEMKFYQNGLDWKPKSMQEGGTEKISINDPRYPELYKNRQVGAYYDGAFTLPDLPEVIVTAPRSYTMDSLRDFTTAGLYGAPATAMNISMIPQAAMTEGIEALRGKPYDFSNVSPNFGYFTSNQRDLSQTMGYENPQGFLQKATNFGLSMIDPLNLVGANVIAKTIPTQAIKSSVINTKNNLSRAIKGTGSFVDQVKGEILQGKANRESIKLGNKWLQNWIDNPATRQKIDADIDRAIALKGPDATIDDLNYLELVRNQSKDFVPNSKEYSLYDQLNDNIDQYLRLSNTKLKPVHDNKNMGISLMHGVDPQSRELMRQGLIPAHRQHGSFISRRASIPQAERQYTTIHEGTHDWIPEEVVKKLGMRNIALKNINPEAKKYLLDIEAGLKDQLTKEQKYLGYLADPTEQHARIMELRANLGLRPGDVVDEDLAKEIIKKIKNKETPVDPRFLKVIDSSPSKLADRFNRFWAVPAVGAVVGSQAVDQQKNGGITKDNLGYWNPNNWGKPVEIGSNKITMKGVYEPLLGISDTGDTKLMQPGKNYKFKGKKVTEFPVAELGINQLDAHPMKKLNQLLNFTNNPDKDNWLDKYN